MGRLYTIGSSIHTIDEFIGLLNKYHINALADVRSVPYSRHTPQFNQDILHNYLRSRSIYYLDFCTEFGARRKEEEAYTNNRVDFRKVVTLPIFLSGVNRIDKGVRQGFNIALLCTEKNPLDCHRFSLVSKALKESLNLEIEHILFDGKIITHEQLEKDLMRLYSEENDLFEDNKTLLEKAYQSVSKKIAFQEAEEIL
jgi:uncharacterized protein (DUF488 family)